MQEKACASNEAAFIYDKTKLFRHYTQLDTTGITKYVVHVLRILHLKGKLNYLEEILEKSKAIDIVCCVLKLVLRITVQYYNFNNFYFHFFSLGDK